MKILRLNNGRVHAPDHKMAAMVAAFAAAGIPMPSMGMDAAPSPWTDINAIIANGDVSTGAMMTLAGAVNAVPFEPSYIGDKGIFHYVGVKTNSVALEFNGQTINLVQTTAPGSPGQETILNPRNVKKLDSTRIARKVTIKATEVANIRELMGAGLDTVQARSDEKIKNAIRDIRSTLEFHRVGAAMGVVLDADATTVLYNYFNLLGISQPTVDCLQGTAATAKYVSIGEDILNMLEDALGALAGKLPIALCGRTFFKRFSTSADVIQAYQYFQSNRQPNIPGRDDLRYEDFEHGGIIWRQYRGSAANSARFIPDAEAHIIVDGVPGTYEAQFCPPQDILSQVGTVGQPIYPTMKVLDHDAGVEIQLQSDPIHWMTRPAAAIKLMTSN